MRHSNTILALFIICVINDVYAQSEIIGSSFVSREDSIDYSNSLFEQGMNYYYEQDFERAIISFEKCYKYEEQLYGPNLLLANKRKPIDYNFLWIACAYHSLGKDNVAKEYSNNYMTIPYDRKKVQIADSLYNSINWNSKDDIIQTIKKICELDSINIGTHNSHYVKSLYDLGDQYSHIKDFNSARNCYYRALLLNEEIGMNRLLHALIYEKLAHIAYQEDDVTLAIKNMKKSLIAQNDTIEVVDDTYLLSRYATLSGYYASAGLWDKALELDKKRVLFWAEKKDSLGYNWALSNLSTHLANAGYYKQALRTAKVGLLYSPSSVFRYADYEIMGNCYSNLSDYNKAIQYYKIALDCYPFPKNSFDYLDLYNSIAYCYEGNGELEKATILQKNIITQADTLSMYDNVFNEYDYYTQFLSNYAYYLNLNQQYDSALVYEDKSLWIKRKYYPSSDVTLADSYINISEAYAGKKEWNKSLLYSKQALNIYKKKMLRNPTIYTMTKMLSYFFHLKKNVELEIGVTDLMIDIEKVLLATFQELTYAERSFFIEGFSDILRKTIPLYAFYSHSDELVSQAFNAALLMKGALLNSEKGVQRIVNESNNDLLLNLWEELRADRYILSKQMERDSTERRLNTDSLLNAINLLEDSLMIKCKEYGDITHDLKLKWNDIKQALYPKDIAIEFLSFPINNDSVMYVALTVRKDDYTPKMTVLFEEKDLKTMPDTAYYQCREMYDLVWNPLLPELQGIKNIYFSPSGALYNIGIEYLPGMEEYNIYRLSSTRELVIRNDANPEKQAVLYGGLDYDAQLDSLSKPKSHDLLDFAFVERANVETVKRGMKIRGGQERLKHTQEEVEQIGEALRKAEWTCLLDTAAIGTEESFKALSGKRISCLHIATHGFYYTPEEADNMQYRFMQLDNQHISAEDKALTRSGLLLSGANHILEGDSIPDNVEDGILTAKEIADVDLRGLDLVVLSACQTGLGDIAQGEGVFGLQRGFKKAGANSILMSLWEVDDNASQILMTQFYKNWLSGMSKHQSLLFAQRYLREYEVGKYDEPKYWAAFILLDGLEK